MTPSNVPVSVIVHVTVDNTVGCPVPVTVDNTAYDVHVTLLYSCRPIKKFIMKQPSLPAYYDLDNHISKDFFSLQLCISELTYSSLLTCTLCKFSKKNCFGLS